MRDPFLRATRLLTLDVGEFGRIVDGEAMGIDRIGFLMQVLRFTWRRQRHLPETLEGLSSARIHSEFGMPARIVRKHWDEQMRGYVRLLVAARIPITDDMRRAAYAASGGICLHCRKPVPPDDFDVAHIVCVANGGMSHPSNLRAAHPSCNRSAGATDVAA